MGSRFVLSAQDGSILLESCSEGGLAAAVDLPGLAGRISDALRRALRSHSLPTDMDIEDLCQDVYLRILTIAQRAAQERRSAGAQEPRSPGAQEPRRRTLDPISS